MPRKTPTPEQKAAAEIRRAALRQLAKDVAALTDAERTALMMRHGGIRTTVGRALTTFNSCFVLAQRPTASVVGGFVQWLTAGRRVKKGAQAIAIWAPSGRGKDAQATPADVEATDEKGRPRCFIVYVFDVADTEEDAAASGQ
ncbi:MAG TPA: hypothetical protein VM529_24890 [Gemmata sp.]|nr:hypothetical protein [Gemmata sp.]